MKPIQLFLVMVISLSLLSPLVIGEECKTGKMRCCDKYGSGSLGCSCNFCIQIYCAPGSGRASSGDCDCNAGLSGAIPFNDCRDTNKLITHCADKRKSETCATTQSNFDPIEGKIVCKRERTALSSDGKSCIPCDAEVTPNTKIKIDPKLEEKFPRLQTILNQLEETLSQQHLWGDIWNKKIKKSGRITNYRFSEIAKSLREYLQDRSIRFSFRLSQATRLGVVAAQTVDKKHIILFQNAGRSTNENKYSEYYLARTIFHELMHIWQYRHWTALGRFMDYEGFPTEMEESLPRVLFSTIEYPNPEGEKPVPPC